MMDQHVATVMELDNEEGWIAQSVAGQAKLSVFRGAVLRGGFTIESVSVTDELGLDAIGRPALARTTTIAGRMTIVLQSGFSAEETSVSLYHEVLEAATVTRLEPPDTVLNLNEAGFDFMARRFHAKLGPATIKSLNEMLREMGF